MAVTYNIKGTTNPSFKIGKKGVVLSPADNTSETTLTIPNATGTAALLESTQTFSGAITFDASGNSVIVSDTLRIAQTGSGLRMTNVGAFDNDGSDNFRIYGTNSLYLRANGENGGGLSIDSANQDVTVDNDLIVSGNLTVQGTTTTVDSTTINVQNAFVFEGTTADEFETTLTVTDPTADRTITLPDASGQLVLRDTTDTLTNKTLTSPTISNPTLTGTYTFTSDATTTPAMTLTANSLNDGVGALRIDGAQADIFLNPSTATHTTVTFAVNEDQRLAFGMDNNSDFYITRRTSSTWYDDTFVLDRDTGLLSLGYGATVAGTLTYSTLNDGTTSLTSTVAELNLLDGVTGTIVTEAGSQTLTNKTLGATTISGHLTPSANVTYDLGTSSNRFRDIYLSGTTIDLGGAKLTNDGSDNLDIKDSSGNRKIIRASAIELVDSSGKKMKLERDATSGKLKQTRKNADNSDEESTDTLDIVGDTSPQLGGDLDTNGNNITFGDNNIAYFGAGNDLAIYHDGTASRIVDTGTGGLTIRASDNIWLQSADSENYLRATANGSVFLYHNGNEKLRTTSSGVTVTGDGEFSGNVTVTGNLTVNGTTTTVNSTEVNVQNAFVFEGATADAFETTLTVTDPTADRTITLPDSTGTVALTSDLIDVGFPTDLGSITGSATDHSGLGPDLGSIASGDTFVGVVKDFGIIDSYISLTTLKAVVSASTDFADFKTRIADL